jgi:hypothetical protein
MFGRLFLVLMLLWGSRAYSQHLGKMAEEKPPEKFPENAWGIDLMFGEGGFGLGTFLRKNLTDTFSIFGDFSISESKDEREIQYVDYFGRTFVFGKKNRVLLLPLNFGVQYRLFAELLSSNLRPYLTLGAGPSFIVTTPYEIEFFSSLKEASGYVAAGGYVGFGANIGSDKSSLLGLNIRYQFVHMFNKGVESMYGRRRKDFGSVYISLSLGVQY